MNNRKPAALNAKGRAVIALMRGRQAALGISMRGLQAAGAGPFRCWCGPLGESMTDRAQRVRALRLKLKLAE